MGWTTRKPGYIGAIEEVEAHSVTESGKQIVRTYTRLFRDIGNKPPRFKDVDIGEIKQAVPYVALCSVKVGAQSTVRFFGEDLRRRVDSSPVGRNLRDFIHPDRADSVQKMMEMIVRYPCGYLANVKQEFMNGQTIIVETIAFPLKATREDEDGQVIMTDTPIRREGVTYDREKVLLSADVLRRDLIDLGYGVDEDFVDLVSDRNGQAE